MLRTLGGLALEGSPFRRNKPLLLVAYLAIEGPQPRRRLAEMFWPGAQDGLNSLSVALNQLRPLGLVEGGEVLRAQVSTDLEALYRAVRLGDLGEVRRLYQGAFLEGVELPLGEELGEWVWDLREKVALEVYQAFSRQARAHFALGFLEEGRALLEEALGLGGVRWAVEGQETPPPASDPLPREARRAYWAFFHLPGRAGEVLSLEPWALERLYAEGLLGAGGQALPLVGLEGSKGLPLEAQEVALELARGLPLREALPFYRLARPLWGEEDRRRAGQAILAEVRRLLSEDPQRAYHLLEGLPREPQACLLRARALERMGRYVEALEELEEGGSEGPEAAALRGALLFRLGRVEEARALAAQAAEGSAWAQGEALNLQGLLAFSEGRFQEAAALFARSAVRFLAGGEAGRQVDALNNRAVALLEAGSPEAEEVLGEALRAAGEVPLLRARVLLNFGVVREKQGRVEEAEGLYQESLEAARRAGSLEALGRAWNNLGALYHRQGQRARAEAAYREALRSAREGREWVLTAAVLANLAELQNDPESLREAIALLKEARYTVLAERYQSRLGSFRPR
ncbi:Tetratricopeptide repeat protein [Meiothermus luteus]|uniref:Tetratricopeptide repeat protein n=1 Tax=Meiothermus luteus TaxID=2026184 RepID=A0A399EH00_9DEIN|nr:tetratricopeptide repeat protein [Meiothermus luteus]RIH83415.1 Tetratricopeptide repeat protein [Meiothermus luteus]RMH57540.1 MAG: tetratricopeptide repeat protein [Deinococcota bacterium]